MIAGIGALTVLAATVLIGPELFESKSGSGIAASDLIVGESSKTIDGSATSTPSGVSMRTSTPVADSVSKGCVP
jgi:hypothetical protein